MRQVAQRRMKFIGCEIIYREACRLAALSPHRVDVEFLRKGLHDLERDDMREKVQATIDAVDPAAGYEAILLGYARCNDGLVGVAARDIPLVIPRAHDCITFFFGSAPAYREYFEGNPGTYFMSTGWAERNFQTEDGTDAGYTLPAYGKQGVMANLGLTEPYDEMVRKYGRENADFIVESMGGWLKHYRNMLYLEMGVCDETRFIEAARADAADHGWTFELRKGDWSLLERLFAGEWDEGFVIVRPGEHIVALNDGRVLAAAR